jgi:energy-coupling factor transport system permease protein
MYLYLDRDTWVHRLHPLVRFCGMIAVFVTAYVVERPIWQLPVVAAVIALLWWTGALRNIYRLRYLFVLGFVTTLLIWTLFYGPDGAPPLLRVGPITVSRTGPQYALGMALKLDTFLAAGILFLSVTRIEEFAYALTRLGLPYRVGFTMTMSFRLVPVFVDAAASVVQAQRCRGLDFERGNLWARVRRYVPVIVPVIMGALRRADQMAMTLDARGFQARTPRTVLEPYAVRWYDVAVALLLCSAVGLYLVLWWRGVLALRHDL